jgi:hypothetical protein
MNSLLIADESLLLFSNQYGRHSQYIYTYLYKLGKPSVILGMIHVDQQKVEVGSAIT